MKAIPTIIFMLLLGFRVFGQDTIQVKQFRNEHSSVGPWVDEQVSFRVGLGFRKSFYTDLGVALHKCNKSDVGFYFSRDYYSALEWIPSRNQNIFGIKVGCQANLYLLNAGVEVKYQTDFEYNDVVITPKVGLGLYGDLNLFYGYNISTNKKPFSQIGSHQFSLVLNLNYHFLRY